MNNVLVTGGAGFIGANFVRHVLAHRPDARVVNLDALTYAGSLENLRDLPDESRHTFVHGDICDRALVDRILVEHDVDTIVHFAAESHVDRSITGPGVFVETNITGTFHLLEAARARGTRFHHVSTDEVFGSLGPDDPAFTETTPYAPSSPYSASKAASDHLVRSYVHTYGLPATISNCSNNYGPYQFPEKLLPLVILNGRAGKPLPIYGDGLQIRDWLHVEDHCEAVLAVVERGRIGQTYNIGGDNQPTNLALVERVCALLDELFPDAPHCPHEGLIELVPDRPGHDRRYAMDIAKVSAELGWRPRYSLDVGLRATIEWYVRNTAWMDAIRDRPTYQDWIDHNYAKRG